MRPTPNPSFLWRLSFGRRMAEVSETMAASSGGEDVVAAPHRLERKWTFWFDNQSKPKQGAAWGTALRKVYTFDTVEEFWWYDTPDGRSVPPDLYYDLWCFRASSRYFELQVFHRIVSKVCITDGYGPYLVVRIDHMLSGDTINWGCFHLVITRNRPMTVNFDRCCPQSGGISRGRRKKRKGEPRDPTLLSLDDPDHRPRGEEASMRLHGENKLRRLLGEETRVRSLGDIVILSNFCYAFNWILQLMALIGEQFEESEEICGIVVSVRQRQDKLALWTKAASNEAVQVLFF
ncbi:hypothetical protein B296_00027151 [Ensete ventricosum]|uniref:mRNA cap-binding protein n=1 Tax=Ensete ventricosum TaxID=4639 RepID=A0A427AFV1_ENSVE|nr:hypothetical protein B296_00027151 [Ensete ventricosum]